MVNINAMMTFIWLCGSLSHHLILLTVKVTIAMNHLGISVNIFQKKSAKELRKSNQIYTQKYLSIESIPWDLECYLNGRTMPNLCEVLLGL